MAISDASNLPPIRSDLEIVPQYFGGPICYVVKDPVSANYYRLGEAEYVVLKCFQAGRDVEETRQEVKRRTGAEITAREVYRFVEQLKGSNLLKSKGMSDVPTLTRQKDLRRKQRIKQFVSNYLFVTIPVWDPDRLLDRLLPYCRFFFSPWFFAVWSGLAAAALWIVVTNFSVLAADAFSLLSGWNLLILSVSVFSIKFFHEIGHALTCKYYGGEVHAIGPAFLVFQPCMYTDTSDAWLLPSKWDRLKVSSSGIIVELMLASIAAIVWISSQPGIIKQVAYAVMIASSVSTILFNANPLLRYDGYYILSDLIEIPNLRIKAGQYVGFLFRRYLLGLQEEEPQATPRERHIFVIYGVARFIYRIGLVFTIGLFLYTLFPPLGIVMWGTSAYGMVLMPIWKQGKDLARHYTAGRVRLKYTSILLILAAILAGIWFIPIDYTVEAPCVVSPARLDVVRTSITGEVESVKAREGDTVRAGSVLGRIRNPELAKMIAKTQAEIRAADARLRRTLNTSAAEYGMELRKKSQIEDRLRELQKRVERLELRAPIDGVVVGLHAEERGALSSPHGFVSDTEMDGYPELDTLEGATIEAGTGLFGVADVSRTVLDVFVYERDVTQLNRGLPMSVALRAHPHRPFESEVRAILPVDVKTLENVGITLEDVGYVPVKPTPEGKRQPLVTLYMVRAPVPAERPALKIGQTGKARITYDSGPMGPYYINRIVRAIRLRLQEAGS